MSEPVTKGDIPDGASVFFGKLPDLVLDPPSLEVVRDQPLNPDGVTIVAVKFGGRWLR